MVSLWPTTPAQLCRILVGDPWNRSRHLATACWIFSRSHKYLSTFPLQDVLVDWQSLHRSLTDDRLSWMMFDNWILGRLSTLNIEWRLIDTSSQILVLITDDTRLVLITDDTRLTRCHWMIYSLKTLVILYWKLLHNCGSWLKHWIVTIRFLTNAILV